MLHHLEKIGLSGSLAYHRPFHLDEGHVVQKSIVQEVKVTNVRAVLGYFLYVAVYVVYTLASVRKLGFEQERLVQDFIVVLVTAVEPDENTAVYVFDYVSFEFGVAVVTLFQVFSVDLLLLFEIVVFELFNVLHHVHIGLYAISGSTVEQPAMKGTLNALTQLYLAVNAQIGAHVSAEGVQGVHLFVGAAEKHNITTAIVDVFHFFDFEIVGVHEAKPAVRKEGRTFAFKK